MMKLLVLAALVLAGSASAQTRSQPLAPAAEPAKPATIMNSTEFTMTSTNVGRSYIIDIATPMQPPPPEGYALIIHTDGFYFPIVSTVATLQAYTGGRPAIVVGVNWDTKDSVKGLKYRTKDLTPPTDPANVPPSPMNPAPQADDFGGAEATYRFIVEELRPELLKRYRINAADQIYYGHSFGGLFGLHMLFNHPEAFQTWILASPSIFWNHSSVLAGEAGFLARVRAGSVAPRVLITVGGREALPPSVVPPGMTAAQVSRQVADNDMVGKARALADRLGAARGAPRYHIAFHEFVDDDHVGSVAPSIARGLAFALKP